MSRTHAVWREEDGVTENEIMVSLPLKNLINKGITLVKRLGTLILCLSLLMLPNSSRAETLLQAKDKYNDSVCNKESTTGQTKTHCQTAHDSLKAADLMVFTTAFYGATVAICIFACANVYYAIPACMAADIGATVSDIGVTAKVSEDFSKEMMTIMPAIAGALGGAYGLYRWSKTPNPQKAASADGGGKAESTSGQNGNDSKPAKQLQLEDGKQLETSSSTDDAGDATKAKGAGKKSKIDGGSCLALAFASAMLIQKSLSTVKTIEKAVQAIKDAEGFTSTSSAINIQEAATVKNQSQALGGGSGTSSTAGGTSQNLELNETNNPQTAEAQAKTLGVTLPPASISGPFAKAFEDATGTPYNDFMAQNRNNAEANAMNALASALPADAMAKVNALSQDYRTKLSSIMSMGNVANTTYSGGGGRGRAGGSGEEDPMAQMLSGLMNKLGGAGQGQDGSTQSGTPVLVFSGAKADTLGINLDQTQNLFELISIRYSKLERRMF